MSTYTARATIDLDAIRANVRLLTERSPAAVLAAVKADAYGHGLLPVARAAVEAGATWLGVAQLSEALKIRRAGVPARILAWLFTPHSDLVEECISADIDLSATDVWAVEMIAAAARRAGRTARVHVEVDTGMSRGGMRLADFEPVLQAARRSQEAREIDVVGIWTHLACADQPGHPSITAQYEEFARALTMARAAGLNPQVRHIANSAATLTGLPAYDMVRPGLACYGLSPLAAPPGELGLTPALRLTSELAAVKPVPAGTGVSYGHTFVTDRPTRIGVVPLGYGDGIPRHASNRVEVQIAGERVPIIGRVCMDQFMVDLATLPVEAGAEVILFGSGAEGEPTAQEWAQAIGTIDYEIVTRLGARIPRVYTDSRKAP